MNFFEAVYHRAPRDGLVEFSVGGVLPSHREFKAVSEAVQEPDAYEGLPQVYFGPSIRKNQEPAATKQNFRGTSTIWVDHDDPRRPVHILPESIAVNSGNNWHLYWLIDEFSTRIDRVETVNKKLERLLLGRNEAFDGTRLLRVPGTINTKGGGNKPCKVTDMHPERVYSLKSLYLSAHVTGDLRSHITTGSIKGFESRSDRDWYIIKRLVDMGFDDKTIELIFKFNACGDKYLDPGTDGPRYLAHTIENARKAPKADPGNTGIVEQGNSYYKKTSKGLSRISTFVLEPEKLLESSDQDYLLCNVRAEGTRHVWEDFVVPKSAFTSLRALTRELPKASWVWLGTDSDVRTLQAHLIARLQSMDMPHAFAVHQMGRFKDETANMSYYVAENGVIREDGDIWIGQEDAPVVYVDPDREVPKLQFPEEEPDAEYARRITKALKRVNEPEVIWPMIGWFMSTPFKPVLEEKQFRFPILNVSGTRGSGKSTTIQQVFQPLLGFKEPRAYNADTTYFVTLTLLGSSKTVPVAFTEFRAVDTSNFNRFVLLAYDTGRDPRGHADQTTTDYPLSAPFCIDGEDMLDDPAALERIVSVQPNVETVREGSDAFQAFQELQVQNLSLMSLPYYYYAIRTDINLLLDQAVEDIYAEFEQPLPARIRKNLTVVWVGVLLFADFLKTTYGVDFMPAQGAAVLRRSLEHVYSTRLGRAPVAADGFIETVVNAAARKVNAFPWALEGEILWFQLSPAFEYWRSQQVRQRQDSLTRKAILGQLQELVGEYMVSSAAKVIKGRNVLAFGVSLPQAYEAGLDVPQQFKTHQFVIDLGGSDAS